MKVTSHITWPLIMAFREFRGAKFQLFIYTLSLSLAVASLVALSLFSNSIESTLETQETLLLGSDIVIESKYPIANEVEEIISGYADVFSREVSFRSMLQFEEANESKLVRVRAVDEKFPIYGEIESSSFPSLLRPENFHSGSFILVDNVLDTQIRRLGIESIRLGVKSFNVVGAINKIPGEAFTMSLLGPLVVIPFSSVKETGLLGEGSIATYKIHVGVKERSQLDYIISSLKPYTNNHQLEIETTESRSRRFGRGFENVSLFLQLNALLAILLASIGIGSSFNLYLKKKRSSITCLRLMGASVKQISNIYLTQIIVAGLVAIFFGGILGIVIQYPLPYVFEPFIPFAISTSISLTVLAKGLLVCLTLSLPFLLFPLISIPHITALGILRDDLSEEKHTGVSFLRVLLVTFSSGVIIVYASLVFKNAYFGVGFFLGLIFSFLFLILISRVIILTLKRFIPQSFPFSIRQGLSNLFRPYNQTTTLMLALGFCVLLVATIHFSKSMLTHQLAVLDEKSQPNLLVFDVQSDQLLGVKELFKEYNLPTIQVVPIVSMRLISINNTSVSELVNLNNIPEWTLTREYRSTYRDYLVDTETLISGALVKEVGVDFELVPISIEEGIAERLGVTIGDTISFNVQGVTVNTVINSIRKVDWRRLQTNFFIVFPNGVLENAPQFLALGTRVIDEGILADFQVALVSLFPNISIINLQMVIESVSRIFSQVSTALHAISVITLLIGIVILFSTILNTKDGRTKDSIILRILGASKTKIQLIILFEYFFITICAFISGLFLSLIAGEAIGYFLFKVPFVPDLKPILVFAIIFIPTVVIIGYVLNLKLLSTTPTSGLRSNIQ
jgi:putative ABC transport system permease protein